MEINGGNGKTFDSEFYRKLCSGEDLEILSFHNRNFITDDLLCASQD